MKPPKITSVGRSYHFRMRVPKRFHDVESRREIYSSLKTGDVKLAEIRAAKLQDDLIAMWEARTAGENPDYDKIVRYCQTLGFSYRPIEEVDDVEYLARMKVAMAAGPADKATADAILGTVKPPSMKVSKIADWYDEHTKYRRLKKNDEQNRIWKSPFLRAAKEFAECCGDMDVMSITRADTSKYQRSFKLRIEAGGYTPSSANKSISSMRAMVKQLYLEKAPDLDNPFSGMTLSEAKTKNTRKPIPDEMIRNWLVPDALSQLNEQARDILFMVVNTGCRPSEICGIREEDIHLDHNIPHFDLVEEGRELKNQASIRKVVVVGVSLEALRRNPCGFPQYRGKHTTLSTTVNKRLRRNKLITEGLSFYGLRHAFKDRLRGARIEDSLKDQLMGHAEKGEKYGEGYDLQSMQEALTEISYS